jgi:hypothetical protein
MSPASSGCTLPPTRHMVRDGRIPAASECAVIHRTHPGRVAMCTHLASFAALLATSVASPDHGYAGLHRGNYYSPEGSLQGNGLGRLLDVAQSKMKYL